MGCGLNKLEKLDEKRPGNIYSTLKRPYVETKIDVSYEYRYIDFTTIRQDDVPGLSAVCLSSLHDLPAQLHDLYQQGFTVAAIHPFVQPTGKEQIPLEHIYRAVLIKKTERNSSTDLCIEEFSLEMELCVSSDQPTDHKLVPDLVKRIEDAASQGSKFAGIIQGYYASPPSLLPSPSDSLSNSSSPGYTSSRNTCGGLVSNTSADKEKSDYTNGSTSPALSREDADLNKVLSSQGDDNDQQNLQTSSTHGTEQTADLNLGHSHEDVFVQEKITVDSTLPDVRRNEILAIFNKPKIQQRYKKYYTVNIPMKISRDGNAVTGLEANWLEHMTDHFRKGCTLVNAVFCLGMVNDNSSEFTDGVFIFEDYPEQEPKIVKRYDAIVVEQWTVLEGLQVQTDYSPLLDSLAVYGWQLTCVLSTPIVKTNRDGNVTTKQIVFLQRPALPHKMRRKESKFGWRFSKDEKHGRHSKKGKVKLNSKGNHNTDEKKELDRNRKNEELTKVDEMADGSLHVNHYVDGIIHSNNEVHNQEITLSTNEENAGSKESLTPENYNASPEVGGATDAMMEMDLGCGEESEVQEEAVIAVGKEVDNNTAVNDMDVNPNEQEEK
ncbi:raftlin [Bombina bombina]|uniref:raftlin n=1 Tax=Bombina bombina TaxID=8345 RepID=UPI00235A973D|nr:raftlin [Bombina bombina]